MTKKKLSILAAAALVALSLSGCFRVTQEITLHEDDTVSGTFVFAFLEEFAEDGDLSQLFGETSPEEALENVTTSEYREDGYVGTQFTFTDTPITSLGDDSFSITRVGDDFVVEGSLGSEDDFAFDGVETWISITFPGAVSDHNGTLDGNTVTWDIADGQYDINATGSAISGGAAGGSGGSAIVWILLILLVVGGVAAYFVIQSRKGKQEADA